MIDPLRVTEDDVQQLPPEVLRELVARLCVAELAALGVSSSAVTWGGHQDAADGGLDILVECPDHAHRPGYVPRPVTGFQVKVPAMAPAGIDREMRPGGGLRPVIAELALTGGAYVIVSAGASVPDLRLRARRDRMRESVSSLPGCERLHVDFYDRRRIASWIEEHPGFVPWARAAAGRPIQGWHSHGRWSFRPSAGSDDYLFGDEIRLRAVRDGRVLDLNAVDGLDAVRDVLSEPGRVVRLVGLSGVGKTRFLEALFDDRLGSRPLAPSLALYADVGQSPEPPSLSMARSLQAEHARIVLIVDNCAAELHRHLADLTRHGGLLSLITVEYDVRDDQPEGTDVYRLDVVSDEVVTKLLRSRHPRLSAVNVGTIARNSGGNPRIALALADTVRGGENIAGLADHDLFLRLFRQRQSDDTSLLRAASACALLYSFEGELLEGNSAELPIIAELAEMTASSLYRHVATLMRRELVQQRGRWRAVLPHALANALAAEALRAIHRSDIERLLFSGVSERIAKSFSRRLGLLSGCPLAVALARSWLEPGGKLADIASLAPLGKAVLANVAPLAPEAVLAALERQAAGPRQAELFRKQAWPGAGLSRLIRSIAYDPALFERSMRLLVRAAVAEAPEDNTNSIRSLLSSLFAIRLSGTHATLEQRVSQAEVMLGSEDPRIQELGVAALDSGLGSRHLRTFYEFDFGNRPRDYGCAPRTRIDVASWYESFLKLAESIGNSAQPASAQVKDVVANNLRQLWFDSGAHEAIEAACLSFAQAGCWIDGWLALRGARWAAGGGETPNGALARLSELEDRLAPRSLADQVRARVLSSRATMHEPIDLDEGADVSSAMERGRQRLEELGRQLAAAPEDLGGLLPDLFKFQGNGSPAWHLGRGLGSDRRDAVGTWRRLSDELARADADGGSTSLIRGFLNGLETWARTEAEAMLDGAVDDPRLRRWFPALQSESVLDAAALARLQRAVDQPLALAGSFRSLPWGRWPAELPAAAIRLIKSISDLEDGLDVAVDIVSRLVEREPVSELVDLGRGLLLRLEPGHLMRHHGYALTAMVQACAMGPGPGRAVADHLCRTMRKAWSDVSVRIGHPDGLVKQLAGMQPHAVLNALLGPDQGTEQAASRDILDTLETSDIYPLDEIAAGDLLAWAELDPSANFPKAAARVRFDQLDAATPAWTEVARLLLAHAPDRSQVLGIFVARCFPRSWCGSLADVLAKRARLLGLVEGDRDATFACLARRSREKLEHDARSSLEWESDIDRAGGEAFE